MNEKRSSDGSKLWGLILTIQEKYPSFIREGARACVFFTAFLLGSMASLFFDMSPYWGWLLWLIAAFVAHVICEQLYRRHVFAWYEANLRFVDED
jgi:hypothetical protein